MRRNDRPVKAHFYTVFGKQYCALCNSGAGGEMNFSRSEGTKLYGMLKKIRPKPITTRTKSEKSCIGCLGCKSSE